MEYKVVMKFYGKKCSTVEVKSYLEKLILTLQMDRSTKRGFGDTIPCPLIANMFKKDLKRLLILLLCAFCVINLNQKVANIDKVAVACSLW